MSNDDSTPLSPALRRFIRENLASHDQLELLVLLSSTPNGATVDDASTRVEIPPTLAGEALEALVEIGALCRRLDAGTTRYHLVPEQQEAVGELARIYALDRAAVTNAMSDDAVLRMRDSVSRVIAAFFALGPGEQSPKKKK